MDCMVIVSIIPARGGSQRIPKKNIKIIAGKPLLAYTIEASLNSKLIDRTYVSTDDNEIAEIARKSGAEIVMRPEKFSKNDSPTEPAMIHAIEWIEEQDREQIDYVVLLQPTSPLRGTDVIDSGIEMALEPDVDSVLSVCEIQNHYLSGHFADGYYMCEYESRPFSQSMPRKYRENGAFYVTKRDLLLSSKNRISGNTKAIIMNELDSIDIDNEKDLKLVKKIILCLKNDDLSYPKSLSKIKLLITDVDGVLTDSGMYYSENGDEVKKFHTRDGMAIRLLKDNGIETAIITGENTTIVRRRADKLGIIDVYQGNNDKLNALEELKKKYNLKYSEIAYVGDDIIDIPVLKKVGFSFCPSDAMPSVKNVCVMVTRTAGGCGVLREFYETWKLTRKV